MLVTDLQVATLRALLAHDWEENRRLLDQLDGKEAKQGYALLVTSAFSQAVMERFRGKKRSEMIQWVADTRAKAATEDQIDPNVAESLILWIFGKASTDHLDSKTDFGHQAILLAFLVKEQELDDAGLDEFLQRARDFADSAAREAGS